MSFTVQVAVCESNELVTGWFDEHTCARIGFINYALLSIFV